MPMYGREDEMWDRFTETGLDFLIERARLGKDTSYTELNTTLTRRTGLPGFNFEHAEERAAMGHLLGLIVERNYPSTKLMISALVVYLNANDAGPGFFTLATQLGLLPRKSSSQQRLDFWGAQLNGIYGYYSSAARR